MAAMDFLTRLAPARIHDEGTIAASVKYFPVAGMVLGGLLCLPLYLGVLAGRPWVQAWLVACGSLWLTRGLHWDGVADVCDALGAGGGPERFWEVLKDSRLGAFGGLGLVLGLGGQIILLHEALAAGAVGAVAFSFVFGRGLCVAVAWSCRSFSRGSGLGSLTLAGATLPALGAALVLTLATAPVLRPLAGLVPALALGLAGLMEIRTLARRMGGLNGDFLGLAIVWGELSCLLGWTLAAHLGP